MKFQDALLAGPEQGTDRMPIEIDRRLRRRLGLESAQSSASTRRVWLRPAIATFAIAAVALAVIVLRPSHTGVQPQRVAVGFVDVSKTAWSGTVTGDEVEVRADSPASATVTWTDAAITAEPGTRLATTPAGSLVLTQGAIQIKRPQIKPTSIVVPIGRVVISAYRSSITAQRDSITVLLDDGTGHYVDPQGQAHALLPGTPLVWPPPKGTEPAPDTSIPAVVPPAPTHANGHATVGTGPTSPEFPAATTPSSSGPTPRQPDAPCTFKSDCDPGATCRENERGESVCMGNGGEGAACWFDGDCLSRQCVQRRCAR